MILLSTNKIKFISNSCYMTPDILFAFLTRFFSLFVSFVFVLLVLSFLLLPFLSPLPLSQSLFLPLSQSLFLPLSPSLSISISLSLSLAFLCPFSVFPSSYLSLSTCLLLLPLLSFPIIQRMLKWLKMYSPLISFWSRLSPMLHSTFSASFDLLPIYLSSHKIAVQDNWLEWLCPFALIEIRQNLIALFDINSFAWLYERIELIVRWIKTLQDCKIRH